MGRVSSLVALLEGYRPQTADVSRAIAVARSDDPWTRASALHVTASALVVHPPTRRVLLRWHARQQAWLQVGGHADPGETDPLEIVLREGREETGLTDLAPWPDASLRHVVVVPVAARGDEPGHEHADVRFVLATGTPDDVRPEKADAALRWLTVAEARELTTEQNLREFLGRIDELFAVRA
ncbi:NUDIX hydrolase [Cryptosporangium sp. NPDC051539]|uniref:NUDIX hydrolase n=1 Tax=Cryptosporangium sp. NPDC051539 TaxID=3363962 RepID=UPI003789B19C